MKPFTYITTIALSFSLTACGQNNGSSQTEQKTSTQSSKKEQTMDYSKITNPHVKSALEAWQNGDSETFLSYFEPHPKMTDDGNPRDFNDFVENACGHEKYLSIDKVENEGKDIYGNFKAGQWGTFPVFFKFHQNAEGKFYRLDIGQAK